MRSEKATQNAAVQAVAQDLAAPANGNSAGVIDQVRELLFGETKRSTDQELKALDAKLDALTATMHARFSEVEALVAKVQDDAQRAQAGAIDDIGSAISQLGASIRAMSGLAKTK